MLAAKAGARVFSFEPCPANYVLLERNVRLNKLANVQIFNTAIAGSREKRQLFLSDDPAQLWQTQPGPNPRCTDTGTVYYFPR